MQPTVCVELTVPTRGYEVGQRVILPEATARYFAERNWAVLLDLDDPEDP